MSMSFSQARGIVTEMQRETKAAGRALLQVIHHLENVQNGLRQLQAAGYRPERVPSTMLLCNEIERIHRQQMVRQSSVDQGLGELL